MIQWILCLLGELEAYGIDGSLLSLISSFLMGRIQKESVNGSLSSSKPVLSGIPQGSVLGPLLFVIYINNLPDKLCSSSLLFADDTKVFREICSESDLGVPSKGSDIPGEMVRHMTAKIPPGVRY